MSKHLHRGDVYTCGEGEEELFHWAAQASACTLKRQSSGCRLGINVVNRCNRPVCDTSNGVVQGFAVAFRLVLSSTEMCCSWQALLSQAP